jgi:hypothetical protein
MNQQWPQQDNQNPKVYFITQDVIGTSLRRFKTSLFDGARGLHSAFTGCKDTQIESTAHWQGMKDLTLKRTYKPMSSEPGHVERSQHVPIALTGTLKQHHFSYKAEKWQSTWRINSHHRGMTIICALSWCKKSPGPPIFSTLLIRTLANGLWDGFQIIDKWMS